MLAAELRQHPGNFFEISRVIGPGRQVDLAAATTEMRHSKVPVLLTGVVGKCLGVVTAGTALQAVKKERFIRTIINTHFTFYFGRELRHQEDERILYKRLWDSVQTNNFAIRSLINTILTSPEYLEGHPLIRAHKRKSEPNRIDQKETAEAGGSLSVKVNSQLSAKR